MRKICYDQIYSSGDCDDLASDISVAAALFQVPRVAHERGLSESVVKQLVMDHIQGRILWIFGEPHGNVLDLNIALDGLK